MVLQTRSVVDALCVEVQERIIDGTYPPGAALAELTLAQEFDVARPTAKAAIEQLVQRGLLRRTRNRTAKVPLMSSADVADLYLSRGAVERAVVVHLATTGHDGGQGAAEALRHMEEALQRGLDVTAFVQGDIDFHRALVRDSGSPRLTKLHETIIGEAHLCMAQVQLHHLLDPTVIVAEHSRILAALGRGDAEGAAREMDDHLGRARDLLLDYLRTEEAKASPA